jgi:hypothetical protein
MDTFFTLETLFPSTSTTTAIVDKSLTTNLALPTIEHESTLEDIDFADHERTGNGRGAWAMCTIA